MMCFSIILFFNDTFYALNTTNFYDGRKDGLEIRYKVDSQKEMLETNEKGSNIDEDISKSNSDLVDTIVNEFVEKLVDVCVNDNEKKSQKVKLCSQRITEV